ncbi:MAG: formate dehydrogenase subunit delta [Gemmatimonadaceae bacterium]|nr:formate dehydrogenase subunit delta [Gemmatimonadaceae bacterium]
MSADDVVRMANQIAGFFAPYPQDEAIAGVADHMEKFWPPSQRKELLAVVHGIMTSDRELHPLAHHAALRLARQVDE